MRDCELVYLVDTNVISAGAPTKARASPELGLWMDRHSDLLYLSVITVVEVKDGIARARRQGAAQKAAHLTDWLETVLHLYGNRVLTFDIPASRIAGRLSDRARERGHAPGFADLAIAATAQAHRLIVLTRNLRHFQPLDVAVHDPFVSLP